MNSTAGRQLLPSAKAGLTNDACLVKIDQLNVFVVIGGSIINRYLVEFVSLAGDEQQ